MCDFCSDGFCCIVNCCWIWYRSINERLTVYHSFNVYRQQPTNVDRDAYDLVKAAPPTAATHPNTFSWFVLVHRFSDAARASWAGAQAAPAKAEKKAAAPKVEAKVEAPVKTAAADDEMDLFGDDEEEDVVSINFPELRKVACSIFNR